MYEFPVKPPLLQTLMPIMWNIGATIIPCAVIVWLCFNKHKDPLFSSIWPSFYSITIALLCSPLFIPQNDSLLIIIWSVTFIAVVSNISNAITHRETIGLWELGVIAVLLLIVFSITILPNIQSKGNRINSVRMFCKTTSNKSA